MNYKRKLKLTVAAACALTVLIAVGAVLTGAYASIRLTGDDGFMEKLSAPDKPGSDTVLHQRGQSLPVEERELEIFLDVYNGGVNILSSTSNEITASYDSEYYDVKITDQDGVWNVNVSGKADQMGKTEYVQLSIPNIKRVMNGFRYTIYVEVSILLQRHHFDVGGSGFYQLRD